MTMTMNMALNYLEKQTLEEIINIFNRNRPKLINRLKELKNSYHNINHMISWVNNLELLFSNLINLNIFTEKEKELAKEAMLRHDDWHCWNTYRQDVFKEEDISNEEYTVELLKKDLWNELESENLEYMINLILSSAFGQNDESKLPEWKKHYYRPYWPRTDMQKLFVLADVGGFINGWDDWFEESLDFLRESCNWNPPDVDTWIKNQRWFIDWHIVWLIENVKDLLKPDFIKKLNDRIEEIRNNLDKLKEPSNKERLKVEKFIEELKVSN